jgi:cytochrome c553
VGFLIALTAALLACPGAYAADAAAGKKKAAICKVCHGLDGIAKMPDSPNLAGQKEDYLKKSLAAFQSGERKNEKMAVVVKPLTEEDIANLAAWYSSIKISVEVPK